jgi:hypothetical protein
MRRATIFAGTINPETGEDLKNYTKTRLDLKRSQQLQIMEFKTIGKQRLYEMASEDADNMLIRFIIHFMFVEHDHRMINLFDPKDSIFQNQTKKASINEVLTHLKTSPIKQFSLSPKKRR